MKSELKLEDFEFRATDAGAKVYLGKKYLGEIMTHHEGNGRHCFRLGCDERNKPRTYRGRLNAALALAQITELATKANRYDWSREKLILEAWDARPLVADHS
jgi:hypothetical protein